MQRRAAGDDRLLGLELREREWIAVRFPCIGAVGSATVGRPASSGRSALPCPEMTTVSAVRSRSTGTSSVAFLGGGPGRTAGTALRDRSLHVHVRHQRLTKWNVEMHRTRVSGSGSAGSGEDPAYRRAPLAVLRRIVLRQAQADGCADLTAEEPELLDGLVGAGAEHLVRPVGAQDHQRHSRVVGLEDSGSEIRDGGPGSHHDGDRSFPGDCQSECQKACCPLVDPHVQTQPAVEIGGLEGKCEGRVARAWTQHDFTHATTKPVRRRRLWLVQWTDSRLQECQMFGRKHAQGRRQRHYVWVRTLFDPADLEPRRFLSVTHRFGGPRPIAWVSTLSADGVGNLAPYSFFTVASSAPPIVQFTSVGRKGQSCATSKRPANS